ncbi:hypothetical protein JOM56_007982 [Amanita muscaria]
MRVDQGELVVATGREPSKMWSVVRLRAPEDNVNRHACALKREGTQTFIGYRLDPEEGKGEIVLGPQARFDVFRVTRMKKPSYIRVYTPPLEECCDDDPGSDDAQSQIAGPSDDAQTQIAGPSDGESSDSTAETSTGTETKPDPPSAVEWYLGISADLKVVIKPFPPMSECSEEMASKRPVWEFTSREEAIRQDYPSIAPTTTPRRDLSQANNPMHRDYYMRHNLLTKFEREYWPTQRNS